MTFKRFIEFAVYPLLLVNLAIGLLMFLATHQLMFVFARWLHRAGRLDGLGPWIFIQQTISICGAVIFGIAILVFFSILEAYYTRGGKPSQLLRRFIRTLGIQLLYLGAVQLAARLVVGFMVVAQLAAGLGLVIFARVYPRQEQEQL